ncbi:hypothetical protein [Acidocella sp.]|jgi:hypothetical protein|uniref:hypothetical protein n=1 Tax=Acidocella sp. TaxID=50710 RepID=UPI002F3F4C8B
MAAIDPIYCGIALRAVTDELARHAWRPEADAPVADLLPRLFEISARGLALLKALLDARYPEILWGANEAHADQAVTTIRSRSWSW